MVLPFLRQTAKRQCHGSVCVQPFLRFFIVSLPSIGLLRFPDRMPCSDAEKLALKAFLGQKRGMRKLISSTHPGRRGCGSMRVRVRAQVATWYKGSRSSRL